METKSKSQVKREMIALQSLGEQLVGLRPDQIDGIQLSEDLREAVLFAKTLKRGEARRRQMQYIGVLMRDTDPERIREALDKIRRGRGLDDQLFHQIEQWRDELVDGNDELLRGLMDRFPESESLQLHRLVLSARKERESNKPPKASRLLFRYLRELSKTHAEPS